MLKHPPPLGQYPRRAQRPCLATLGADLALGSLLPLPCPWVPVSSEGPAQISEALHLGVQAGRGHLALSCVRSPRFVILSVVLFGLVYNPDEACSLNLVDHGRGYLGILLSCMIAEMAIIWLSMRGGILYTEPRESMQYVLYVRLGKGHPPWAGGYSGPPHPHPLLCPTFIQPAPGASSEQADSLHPLLDQGWADCSLRAKSCLLSIFFF